MSSPLDNAPPPSGSLPPERPPLPLLIEPRIQAHRGSLHEYRFLQGEIMVILYSRYGMFSTQVPQRAALPARPNDPFLSITPGPFAPLSYGSVDNTMFLLPVHDLLDGYMDSSASLGYTYARIVCGSLRGCTVLAEQVCHLLNLLRDRGLMASVHRYEIVAQPRHPWDPPALAILIPHGAHQAPIIFVDGQRIADTAHLV